MREKKWVAWHITGGPFGERRGEEQVSPRTPLETVLRKHLLPGERGSAWTWLNRRASYVEINLEDKA